GTITGADLTVLTRIRRDYDDTDAENRVLAAIAEAAFARHGITTGDTERFALELRAARLVPIAFDASGAPVQLDAATRVAVRELLDELERRGAVRSNAAHLDKASPAGLWAAAGLDYVHVAGDAELARLLAEAGLGEVGVVYLLDLERGRVVVGLRTSGDVLDRAETARARAGPRGDGAGGGPDRARPDHDARAGVAGAEPRRGPRRAPAGPRGARGHPPVRLAGRRRDARRAGGRGRPRRRRAGPGGARRRGGEPGRGRGLPRPRGRGGRRRRAARPPRVQQRPARRAARCPGPDPGRGPGRGGHPRRLPARRGGDPALGAAAGAAAGDRHTAGPGRTTGVTARPARAGGGRPRRVPAPARTEPGRRPPGRLHAAHRRRRGGGVHRRDARAAAGRRAGRGDPGDRDRRPGAGPARRGHPPAARRRRHGSAVAADRHREPAGHEAEPLTRGLAALLRNAP